MSIRVCGYFIFQSMLEHVYYMHSTNQNDVTFFETFTQNDSGNYTRNAEEIQNQKQWCLLEKRYRTRSINIDCLKI